MVFIFSLIVFLIAGLFCFNVAEEKGYNGFLWFIGGFLFSVIALIAVAGLPDRKLRKYIRQIGEKQNAIEPDSGGDQWVRQPSNWDDAQKKVNK